MKPTPDDSPPSGVKYKSCRGLIFRNDSRVLYENTGSYEVDMAAMIDTEEEIIADEFGVTLPLSRRIIKLRDDAVRREQATMLASVIGLLIRAKNLPAMVHSLALAFGLSELNGVHSQSEVARRLGVTRALISHYVVGWRDILAGKTAAFDCTKFRKGNATREIYRESAESPLIQAKKRIQQKKA